MSLQNSQLSSTDRRKAKVDLFIVDPETSEIQWTTIKIDFKKVTGATFAELTEMNIGNADAKTRLVRQLAFLEVGSDDIRDGDKRAVLTESDLTNYDVENLQEMMNKINEVTFPKKPMPQT